MPSPLGHGLAAVAIHAASARSREELLDIRRAGVSVVAATAPDLDLLLRFVDGRNHHQAESHSIGFALLAGLAAWLLARVRGWPRPATLAALAAAAWLSHVGLDYLGRDTHPPIGLMAFWPVSEGYYKFPWPVFLDIGRTLEWNTVRNNVVAIAWELVLLLPPAALCSRYRYRKT